MHAHFDLTTGQIELCASESAGDVKGNRLNPNKVLAGRGFRWDGEGNAWQILGRERETHRITDEDGNHFINLEPSFPRSRVFVVGLIDGTKVDIQVLRKGIL